MLQQKKMPRLVTWPGYIAAVLLVLLPVAVLTVRSGLWQPGLLMYAIACLGSTALVILAIVLLMSSRFAAWRSAIVKRTLLAVPGTVLLLSLVSGGGDTPMIHDISTDTVDPPLFTMAPQQRGSDANSLEIDPQVIAQQKAAYPDLKTLPSDLSVEDAFTRAVQVAQDLGWTVYRQDRSTGVIEAVDTTRMMAFKDDVVIRIRNSAHGSLLDLRSVSRIGGGDTGTNAKRIRAFQAAFQQQG